MLDEWGSSGRIRPTLGHLLQLLTELKLFLVADYIAVDLLKEAPPPRPSAANDPAARIDISLGLDELTDDDDDGDGGHSVANALSAMEYPMSSDLLLAAGGGGGGVGAIDLNKDYYEKLGQDHVRKVVIDTPRHSSSATTLVNNSSESFRPNLSDLLNSSSNVENGSRLTTTTTTIDDDDDVLLLPDISALQIRTTMDDRRQSSTEYDESTDSNYNPNISDLMVSHNDDMSTMSTNIPNVFSELDLVPQISENSLHNNSIRGRQQFSSNLTNDDILSDEQSANIPNVSLLNL